MEIVKLHRKTNRINKKKRAIIKMCILFSNLVYYNHKLSGKCTLSVVVAICCITITMSVIMFLDLINDSYKIII